MSKINPSHFEAIAPFPDEAPEYVVNAVIETPRNTRHKYALEPKYGMFKLRQTIAEGLEWPYDYGFIPQTLGDDGDPLDVLFLNDEPTFPGCLVEGRLLGLIRLEKNGVENDRLIACAARYKGVAQSTDPYETMSDLPEELVRSLCRFLVEYSQEQGNKIEFKGVQSRKKALQAIEDGMKAYKKKKRAK